jgi:hypothetical protein
VARNSDTRILARRVNGSRDRVSGTGETTGKLGQPIATHVYRREADVRRPVSQMTRVSSVMTNPNARGTSASHGH